MWIHLKLNLPDSTNFESPFASKWAWFMSAFDKALGQDTQVKSMISYHSDRKDYFGGLPVYSALNMCGQVIDNGLGSEHKDFTTKTHVKSSTQHILNSWKFDMAFENVFMRMPVGCDRIRTWLGRILHKNILEPTIDYSQFLREIATIIWPNMLVLLQCHL